MTHFYIPSWSKYQHYKHRNPPWIKLHFELLSSELWVMVPDASKALAIACMLIASKNEGTFPNDPAYIKRVAYLSDVDFTPLIKCGFIEPLADASTCKQLLDQRQSRDRVEIPSSQPKVTTEYSSLYDPDAPEEF